METEEVSKLNLLESETLHKVFVDLSLKNDIKEEETEWFRSRIITEKDQEKDEIKPGSGKRKIEIITGEDLQRCSSRPSKLHLKLSETQTIWLFSLETSLSQDDLEDIERVRLANETYQMKKIKKELIRKRCMAETQTPRFIEKSVGALTSKINKREVEVLASDWDLHDTYNATDKCEMASCGKYLTFIDSNKKNQYSEIAPTKNHLQVDQVNQIFACSNFKYLSLVTERLLASNCYQSEQSVFKKKFKFKYDDESTLFSYEMKPLWNFQKDLKNLLMVTAMDWNPLHQDILAVGYGSLEFNKHSSGLICIWSPKNPRQPEKEFRVDDSVTALNYSKARPNILAVGTRKGNIYVLDVSSETGNIRILRSDSKFPSAGPVWKVEWFLILELSLEVEKLLAVGESGALLLFSTVCNDLNRSLLRMDYVISAQKLSLQRTKRQKQTSFRQGNIFEKKTFSGLSFSFFSNGNFCYISTKEGVLVKCNLRNPSMSDGILLAHDGPVYIIEHSPSTDLIYFTCGADWNIKIWMEGIPQALITLQHKSSVVCARWSPTIPTLIASIGQAEVYLWDIARNVLSPMAVKKFEDCAKPLSILLFSSNGKNLVIGGQDGLSRVINLSQLPRISFLPKQALISAIGRALKKNGNDFIGKFNKVVETNKEKLKTQVIV